MADGMADADFHRRLLLLRRRHRQRLRRLSFVTLRYSLLFMQTSSGHMHACERVTGRMMGRAEG